MIVKVCGMRLGDNIRQVEALGVEMIGMVFFPRSPRYVPSVPGYLPARATRVGVFVDAAHERIVATATRYGLQAVQLHGSESPQQCARLAAEGLRVIKALPVAGEADVAAAAAYARCGLSYLLFDTKTVLHGGCGRAFPWQSLAAYRGRTPFLLSGGIAPDSLAPLRAFAHPQWAGVDLNSRFETAPAVKDVAAIRQFLAAFRSQ